MERTLQVLLVEDNPGDVRLIREMLRTAAASQFRLVEAQTLAEGLEAMSFRDSDVILLDLSLPDSSGYETFLQAKSVAGNVPIVVLTGMEDDDLALQCVREGAQDYLPKNRMADRVLERAILYAVERKAADVQRQLTAGILQILNRSDNTSSMVADMLRQIKSTLSFEVAAIRLREAEDYPYFAQSGFSDEFLSTERSLFQRDEHEVVLRDEQGRRRLECYCGAVIRGNAGSLARTVTAGGSFWTNHNTAIPDASPSPGPQGLRFRCCREGYESVALIPVRSGEETIGLLQLADHRTDRFSLELVESLEGIAASVGIALKRRQAEQALTESEESYRRIVETSGEGILTLDAKGVVTLVNHRLEEMTGWSASDLVGRPATELLDEETRAHFQSTWQRQSPGVTDIFETKVLHKDGSDLWVLVSAQPFVNDSGEMTGLLMMMADVSGNRRAQRELAEARNFLDRLIENAPVPIYASDPEGRYLLVNAALTRLLGLGQADIIGKTPRELYPAETAGRIDEANRYVLALKKPTQYLERVVVGGEEHFLDTVKFPMLDASGAVMTGIAGVSVDRTQRQLAEAALSESEARYRGQFENAPVGILHSLPGGRYVRVNPAFAQMLGYSSPEDLISSVQDIGAQIYVDPSVREKLVSSALKEASWMHAEVELRRKDGGSITVNLTTRRVMDAKGEPAYLEAFAEDITERRRAEEQVRDLSTRIEAILAAVPDIIATVDNDKIYTWTNQAGREFLGDDAIGREAAYYFEGESNTYKVVQPLFDGSADRVYVENWQRRKDGEKRLLAWWCRTLKDDGGSVVGALSTGRDITEQRRAEAALRESESWLRGVFEQAGVGIAHLTLDGQFVRVNRRFCDIVGRDETEISQLTAHAITHPDDIDFAREKIHGLVAGDGQPFSIEKRYVRKDGTAVWASVSVSLARDGAGAPAHMIALLTDISERKRAEQALDEARAFTAQLIENAPVTVSVVDTDGTYTLVNRALAELYHSDPSKVIGSSLSDHYPPQVTERLMAQNRSVAENMGPMTFESDFDLKDGQRCYQTAKFPVLTSTGAVTGIATIGVDITEGRRAQEELRASEEKFRSVVEQSSDGIVLMGKDGKVIEWNSAMERISGLPASEAIGRPLLELVQRGASPDEREAAALEETRGAIDGFVRSGPSGRPHLVQNEVIHTDGTKRIVEASMFAIQSASGPIGATIMRDVTDRKRAEAALHRYALLSEHARDIVLFVSRDGLILEANRAAVETYGWTREELLSKELRDLFAVVDTQVLSEQIQTADKEGTVFESTHYRKDGTSFPVEISSRSAGLGLERIYIHIVRDITDRKRLEEQFRQSQKMESVGRLAGGVAHDFNNLLTAITGYANFALEDLSAESRAREDILEVLKAAGRAGKLTQQLLAFSRRQVLQPQVISLNDLVLDVEKMLRRLIGENIDLVSIPDPNLAAILADPGHMEQILVNLAVNARDAMPDGGTLTIETSNVTLDEAYARRHAGARVGEHVLLVVSDSGTGMTDEVKSHLFEPFYTTKGLGRGTGLGLATVFGIVRQHQGSIWVYSEPGQGTSFKIYFPRSEKAAERVRPPVAVQDMPTGHETILLAEDEDAVRELSIRTLQGLGYHVLEASDGVNALEVTGKYEGKIDLLLTDVIMPRMGGKDLAVQLTQRLPDVKVLYVSGYTENGIVRSGVLEESTAFLQKPYTSRSLAFKVRAVLDAPATAPYSDLED